MRKMLKKFPPLVIALGIASTPYLFVESAPALFKWWVVMLASGVAIAGLFIRTVWRRSGVVAALLLVGFSAQLGLTYPIWFQQIELSSSSSYSYVLYLMIAVQAGAATWLLVTGGGLSRIIEFVTVIALNADP